jgi:hypothetical protein
MSPPNITFTAEPLNATVIWPEDQEGGLLAQECMRRRRRGRRRLGNTRFRWCRTRAPPSSAISGEVGMGTREIMGFSMEIKVRGLFVKFWIAINSRDPI